MPSGKDVQSQTLRKFLRKKMINKRTERKCPKTVYFHSYLFCNTSLYYTYIYSLLKLEKTEIVSNSDTRIIVSMGVF